MRYLKVFGVGGGSDGAAGLFAVFAGAGGGGCGVGYGPPVVALTATTIIIPYACAPYGYYGPDWFAGGVFIGAGPWYGWGRPWGWGGWGRGGWGWLGLRSWLLAGAVSRRPWLCWWSRLRRSTRLLRGLPWRRRISWRRRLPRWRRISTVEAGWFHGGGGGHGRRWCVTG